METSTTIFKTVIKFQIKKTRMIIKEAKSEELLTPFQEVLLEEALRLGGVMSKPSDLPTQC